MLDSIWGCSWSCQERTGNCCFPGGRGAREVRTKGERLLGPVGRGDRVEPDPIHLQESWTPSPWARETLHLENEPHGVPMFTCRVSRGPGGVKGKTLQKQVSHERHARWG